MAVKRMDAPVPDIAPTAAPASPDDASCPAARLLSCLRPPQQQRGERRVSAILDAAAELITEVGPGALTVQALADRARTSKGSLYHFFPDLPAVLRALADRHVEAIGALTQATISDAELRWAGMPVEEVVRRFLAPLAYLEQHPDLLALARSPVLGDDRARRLAPLCDLADHLLRQRYPTLEPHQREVRAATMVATLDGVVGYGLRSETVSARAMVAELARVLAGYLTALDAEASAAGGAGMSPATAARHG